MWFNRLNHKFYIGSASNLYNRLNQYFYPSHLYKNRVIHKALLKYGHYSFFLIILYNFNYKVDRNILLKKEQYYMDLLKPYYNMTKSAFNTQGFIFSEESKRKMSLANKGKKVSDETRIKLSLALSGSKNPQFGKKVSDETRMKLSLALSGKNHPQFGKKLSDETRMKLSLANKGKNLSDETKMKISLSSKNRIVSLETRKKISLTLSKKVYIYDKKGILIHSFNNRKDLSLFLNIHESTIRSYIRSNKLYKGLYFIKYS
jgi:uncharacterized protein YcfL